MGNALQDFLDEDKPSRTPSVSKNAIRSFLEDKEVEEKDEPLPTIKDRSLKVDDIVNTTQYVEKIRDYMVDRKGKQFLSMDKEELVDKFVTHMRYFNTNEAFTLDEARYVSMADDDAKGRAGEAYKVYDMLGNVFVNDGFGGAVGGVADYLSAIATSPSTYIGLGVGKGLTMIGGKLTTKAVKEAAKNAGLKAVKDNLKKGMTVAAAREIKNKAKDDVIKKAIRGRSLRNTTLSGAMDGSIAGWQDYTLQSNVLGETGAIEDYSILQTGLSVFGSGIGTGLSIYGTPKITGADTRGLTGSTANKIIKANRVKQKEITDKKALERINKKYLEKLRKQAAKLPDDKNFVAKITRPYDYTGFPELAQGKIKDPELAVSENLKSNVLEFIFGNAEDSPTANIVRLVESEGAVFRPNMNPTQKYARAFQYLDKETLQEISDLTKQKFGVYLGEVLDDGLGFASDLGKKVAGSVSEAAKTMRVTQLRNLKVDEAITQATVEILEGATAFRNRSKALGIPQNAVSRYSGYAQNVWKRMLVSAPQTTAANVFGFGQIYVANTAQELLQGTLLGLTGETGKAKALFQLQVEKIKNLVDPYSTLDNYQTLIETDSTLHKMLRETISGGIERSAEKLGIDQTNKALRTVEGLTRTAQAFSMVDLQDTLTKSQAFMAGIDKQLRLQKDTTLNAILEKGSLVDIDEGVMEKAMSETLKAVFAEDYTKSGKVVASLAKTVETLSNAPGIGFILPFGRFMNNVVATAYRYGPGAYLDGASAIMKGSKGKIDATEAIARATVGTTALFYAMDFQNEQQKRGYQWYELQTGSGETTNITNTFPLSLLMITGRVMNKRLNGEFVDRDLATEFGKQIAIGQAATDLQFGNDITRLIQLSFNADGEFKGPLSQVKETLGHMSGNIISGVTRPLDPINKLAGYALSEFTPYDVTPQIDRRLAKGGLEKLGLNTTKYTDNIIEGIASFVNGETTLLGDELRVATREGKVFDPSPYRTAIGTRIQQPRTFANMVFAMVDKPEWKAGMYTGVPEFDNFANQVISPMIEMEAEQLLKNEKFMRGSSEYKKQKVNDMLNEVKRNIRSYLSATPNSEQGIEYRKTKLLNVPKLTMMRARKIVGIQDVDVRDLSGSQISELEAAVQYIQATDD